MKEREISLLDMLAEMLMHWRIVLALMLAGGIALGGLSYFKSYQATKAQSSQEQQENENTVEQERLTAKQRANVEAVFTNEQIYNDMCIYRDNSILMQIDANNMVSMELIFLIQPGAPEQPDDMQKIYKDLLSSNAMYAWIADKQGIMPSAAEEIISIKMQDTNVLEKKGSNTLGIEIQNIDVLEKRGSNTLGIEVIHYDESDCKAIAQTVIDYVSQMHNELENLVGSHNVILLEQTLAAKYDSSIIEWQYNYLANITALQTGIADSKEHLSQEEQAYYDDLTINYTDEAEQLTWGAIFDKSWEQSETAGETEADIGAGTISIKYVVLGMLIAAFGYVFVVFLLYIMNNKIRVIDNMQDIYDIPQLGTISGQDEKRKLFGFIDERIKAFCSGSKRRFPREDTVRLSAAAIKLAVTKGGLHTVHFIGCDLKNQTASVCDELKAILNKDHIEVKVLDNILYDAGTLEELSSADGVVLVERAGKTMYDEILQELEVMKRQEILVLGGIVVE